MSDPVRRLLSAAGRRAVPPPDPAFADALEARLAAVASTLPAAGEAGIGDGAAIGSSAGDAHPIAAAEPGPRVRHGSRRRVAMSLAAAAMALALVVVLLPGSSPVPAPSTVPAELGEPHNVAVTLPDGSVLEDPGGLLLPLGAVVDVGPGGSARIGELELRAGDRAEVTSSGLTITRANGDVETPPIGSPAPGGDGAIGSVRPSEQAGGGTSPAPSGTPTSAPRESDSAAPASGLVASDAASPSPRPTPTATQDAPGASTTPRPTPTPTPLVLRPRLRVALVTGPRLAITWTATWGADHYLLLVTRSRGGTAADPVYPGGTVLAEFAAPPSPRFHVRVPVGVTEVRLLVVAVRADGSVIRRSLVEVVAIPPAPTPSPVPTPTPTPTSMPVAAPSPTPAP